MPQISKIRIVNFSFNDGNRFIPDELYDLADESDNALNSLFNLNNGGGKTVLVQLMMQPVNPKAMAGGRHIEEYFSHPGNHSFVLIEWTTDGSKQKLLTGIAIAASISNSSDEQRGNAIKYYTFKTVYDNYSPYSIASLELSKSENGKFVVAPFDFVRDKAKASKGVLEYYSSDDSVKWAEVLSEYGILRSEWENVIETLNKDEGGLNQYFDDAKTSDKLISKFFIPAIEQKMKSVATKGTDGSLETMLISYAKKISEKEAVIQERDTNKRLLATLSELNDMSDQLYTINDRLGDSIGEACGFKAALMKKISAIETEIAQIDSEIKGLDELLEHIDYEEKSKVYYLAEEKLKTAKLAYEERKVELEACKAEVDRLQHEEDLLQCAKLYGQIKAEEGKIAELKKLISDRENDSEDAERIASLKYSVLTKAKEQIEALNKNEEEKSTLLMNQQSALSVAEQEKNRLSQAFDAAKNARISVEADLDAAKKSSDRRIERLDIGSIRQFDGFYLKEEIEAAKKEKKAQEQWLQTEIEKLEADISKLEERKTSIPGEIIDTKHSLSDEEKNKKDAETELIAYDELYAKLKVVCENYSLNETAVFTDRLSNVIKEEEALSRAKLNKIAQDNKALEERLGAAKNGSLHVLPEIMKYIISTGINGQTGEEYLCGLIENGSVSQDDVTEILYRVPELAYSVILFNERDLNKLITAGNADWLPAAVPLFTMEQIEAVIEGENLESSHLAAYDRAYFADRSGYCDKVSAEISELEQQIKRFEQKLEECEREKKLVEGFSYPVTWREEQERKISAIESQIREYADNVSELEEEFEAVQSDYREHQKSLRDNQANLSELNKWLDLFAELCIMLDEEIEKDNKLQTFYVTEKNAENDYKEKTDEVQKIKDNIENINNKLKALREELARISEIHNKVDNAKESVLIEGSLDELYAQYQTLYESMSEDLNRLKENLDSAVKEKNDKEDELATYQCCEVSGYDSIIYNIKLLESAREECKKQQELANSSQAKYEKVYTAYISAQAAMENAVKALDEYGSQPLSKNEIGDDFKVRRVAARKKIRSLSERMTDISKEKSDLDKIEGRVSDKLDETGYGEVIRIVELTFSPGEQWTGIKNQLSSCRDEYSKQKDKLIARIRDAVSEYKDITLAEIVGKLNAVKDMLDDVGIKGDRLFTVSESIGTMIASIEKINSQIETDLREIENDFEDIVNQCVKQGQRMYTDLRAIACSSKAHIFPGKPQTQMVKMNLPEEKEISEEASRIAIRTELETGANEIRDLLKEKAEEKAILKRAKVIVGSERLLHKYIRQESIQVKVYKIDMNIENSTYKRWEDTLTQSSGAEKFVVFFSVVLTLMNYTRSSEGLLHSIFQIFNFRL